MEADSTTLDSVSIKNCINDSCPTFPFPVLTDNIKFYKDNIYQKNERQLIQWLQEFGMIPKTMLCTIEHCNHSMQCKPARVIDRMQWKCPVCSWKLPLRFGSFFTKLQCSMLQVLQLILAWCEDADCEMAAQYFGVKPRVASAVFERLDDLVIEETKMSKLGGDDSVVLCEMYPDCVNRLSPDTTDQPHAHRILMLADTKHIPTRYRLHVIRNESKMAVNDNCGYDTAAAAEVGAALRRACAGAAPLVRGRYVPAAARAATPLLALAQRCDTDMRHFLCERIWRQAIGVCAASRELCAGAAAAACAPRVQRYLDAAAYRLRHGDGFYRHVLALAAARRAPPHEPL